VRNDRVRAISNEYLAERQTSIVQPDQDKGTSIVQMDQDKGLSSKQDREGLPATLAAVLGRFFVICQPSASLPSPSHRRRWRLLLDHEVYDKTFAPATLDGNFSDPNIPAGFAPFGIANIDNNLYVTYAKQNAQKNDVVAGAGLGFVNVFPTDGVLIKRFASDGALNAPWASPGQPRISANSAAAF
jgi:hypothetical protein